MADLLADFATAVSHHSKRVAIVDGKGRETSFAALKSRADGLPASGRPRVLVPVTVS